MGVDDAVAHAEPESGPLSRRLGGEERLEDALQRLFGHPGAGGSLGYANPELGIGYGYVMNRMGNALTGDPRTIALNDAVLSSLG